MSAETRNRRAERRRRVAATAAPSECSVHSRETFLSALHQRSLRPEQMAFLNIFDGSGSLLIGFFATSFIYERVVPLAPETQLLQLTMVVIAISLPLMWLLSKLLSSELAYASWRDNPSWCMLLLQFGSVLRSMCFFICTHFVYGVLLAYFVASECSLLECLALFPVVVISFHFFVAMLRPVK